MLYAPSSANHLPIFKPGKAIYVDFELGGVRRRAFWFKVSKKGDIVFGVAATSNRLNTGIAQQEGRHIQIGPTHVVARGVASLGRNHFSLHPADSGSGKLVPVLHGAQGLFSRIELDLCTISRRHLVMVHRLASPDRYPLMTAQDRSVCFELPVTISVPEFHLFVLPIIGREPADDPVPFIAGYSSDFVIEPVRGSSNHLLFQLRLGSADEISVSDHAVFIPQF